MSFAVFNMEYTDLNILIVRLAYISEYFFYFEVDIFKV